MGMDSLAKDTTLVQSVFAPPVHFICKILSGVAKLRQTEIFSWTKLVCWTKQVKIFTFAQFIPDNIYESLAHSVC